MYLKKVKLNRLFQLVGKIYICELKNRMSIIGAGIDRENWWQVEGNTWGD